MQWNSLILLWIILISLLKFPYPIVPWLTKIHGFYLVSTKIHTRELVTLPLLLVAIVMYQDGKFHGLKSDIVCCYLINPYQPIVPLLYPLKTSENQRFSGGIKVEYWTEIVNFFSIECLITLLTMLWLQNSHPFETLYLLSSLLILSISLYLNTITLKKIKSFIFFLVTLTKNVSQITVHITIRPNSLQGKMWKNTRAFVLHRFKLC